MAAVGLSVEAALKVVYAMHRLDNYLIRDGLLTAQQANEILHFMQDKACSFTEALHHLQYLTDETLIQYCTKTFHLSIHIIDNIEQYDIAWAITALAPDLIMNYRALPLKKTAQELYLGITDPTDQNLIATLNQHTGLFIQPVLITESTMINLLKNFFATKHQKMQLQKAYAKITLQEKIKSHQQFDEKSIIEFVDQLIHEAISQSVTDIHLEPGANNYRVRFRANGLLEEMLHIPLYYAERVVTRLKVIGYLDIAERRLPQDGHLTSRWGKHIHIRINTCPTIYGEKIALRILDTAKQTLNLNTLGLSTIQHAQLLQALNQPQGLILVTGPTGSGKSTTLYSALHYLNQKEKNIISIEDPVEIILPGINQVNIHPKIGLTFSNILRHFLRQDPDIIMIGEIRDKDTAILAVEAAQTGHLVLATLHTNHAFATLMRLQQMGIPELLLTNTLHLIVAQRLIHQLCIHCRRKHENCNHCREGYAERIAMFECLPLTPGICRELIANENHDYRRKWPNLWKMGEQLVQNGITDQAEIIRVLGNDEKFIC